MLNKSLIGAPDKPLSGRSDLILDTHPPPAPPYDLVRTELLVILKVTTTRIADYIPVPPLHRSSLYNMHVLLQYAILVLQYTNVLQYTIVLQYAPLGDLTSNISEAGLGELYSKRVASQVGAALGFIHSKVT